MNQYLKKYQLTTEGQRIVKAGSGMIHFPANALGDPDHKMNLGTIFDDQAASLFFRKDKKGQAVIQPRRSQVKEKK